ncbi:tRNA (adenosine(37)-N6)-dimethylallyltransferase MiaA [Reichenbachiella sp. 5M10]|uniref:tRNA (adenosine(37)-N6)-dimethylallyltransferase MiaA n=1 Tax=Reichenbachiella sp. 5M10 TaxID=1889772 RepID=UPI000C15B931|nr:tRNA (adenosine(37)-N6)-dimethylallyltransferase MiaA [Reichenbachiella sp. 5M10]PIB36014.1 tRNA (adenosine(37)-N6)-dimethylallyltransferase MiaA [Reichenbachiella sp. 5M10]
MKNPLLVVIAGPTAVGKTALSIRLATTYQTEILSADSRQFYREMEIGTAKPDQDELEAVPHHFINSHSVEEEYDAGQFAEDADALLQRLFEAHDVVFVVGGSGLYIKALCEGLDEMPAVPAGIRETLREELETVGLEVLLAELEEADPVYYAQVDRHNHQRVIRALEVIRATGRPFSSHRQAKPKRQRSYDVLKIGIHEDRKTLYQRIDDRMDVMIAEGLFDEAEALYPHRTLNALQTVGYREIFGYLDGAYDRAEAVRLLKRNSRRYAKRQMTWFSRDDEFHWFERGEVAAIQTLIDEKIKASE